MFIEFLTPLTLFVLFSSIVIVIQTVMLLVLRYKASQQAKSMRMVWKVIGEHLERSYVESEAQAERIQQRSARMEADDS